MGTMKQKLTDKCLVDLHKGKQSTLAIVDKVVSAKKRENDDGTFYVCDIGDIIQKVQVWTTLLPRVKMFYAVKCNSDAAVLKVLADMGSSFDCSSKNEIEAILNLGVSPTRIVYAHPCKPVSSLVFANRRDVSLMTFDCENELYKVKESYPSARLLLRIMPEVEFDARLKFDGRYGCPSKETENMLQLAKDLDLNIVGVCFHTGSDMKDPRAYIPILQQSKNVFNIAHRIGFNMTILDIGGGFPGERRTYSRFKEMSEVINETLLELFPPEDNIEIIAEPGRYVIASAFTLAATVIGKRCNHNNAVTSGEKVNGETNLKESTKTYFLYDSVFGNFLFGHLYKPGCVIHCPRVIKSEESKMKYKSVILGATLAPGDCLNRSAMLPDLDVGDWIYYEDMGAYTLSVTTAFNGLEPPAIIYHCLEELWYQAYPDSRS